MPFFILSILPIITTAQQLFADALDGINTVSGTLPSGGTTAEVNNIIVTTISDIFPLFYAIAILGMMVSGFLMTANENKEETTAVALRTFFGSATGLILTTITEIIHTAFFEAGSPIVNTDSGGMLAREAIGVANYITGAAGILAVLFIIVSGIMAIVQLGGGEGITILRRTVVGVITGIVIILLRSVLIGAVYINGNPTGLIARVVGFVQQVINLLGVLAVAIIIYAGFLMILNVGNDDQYQRARRIILRVLVGLVIILVSKGLLNSLFLAIAN